jgi:hypothetical protein
LHASSKGGESQPECKEVGGKGQRISFAAYLNRSDSRLVIPGQWGGHDRGIGARSRGREKVMRTRRARAIALVSSETLVPWTIASLLAGALTLIAWCAVSL